MLRVYTCLFLLILGSCQTRKVTRIEPSTQIDLSGRWNDVDSRKVADQMIFDLFNSSGFQNYSIEKNKKPVIIVGVITNKTSEHIDAENFVKKIELVIHNSNLADIVESGEFRDQLRVERAQQQITGCEKCRPLEAELPFDWIWDEVTGSDPGVPDYVLQLPAKCPSCRTEIREKTLVERS